MGTDFRKLKVPFVWYDLIHVLDVLSRFAWLKDDPRLLDMLGILISKADDQGRFTLESVWTAWKDWEFGQKKEPSRWLTLMAWRILGRMDMIPSIIVPGNGWIVILKMNYNNEYLDKYCDIIGAIFLDFETANSIPVSMSVNGG